jgi:hypothetical protein
MMPNIILYGIIFILLHLASITEVLAVSWFWAN